MLVAFVPHDHTLERMPVPDGAPAPAGAVWLDPISPSAAEDRAVETAFAVAVPTREEMRRSSPRAGSTSRTTRGS